MQLLSQASHLSAVTTKTGQKPADLSWSSQVPSASRSGIPIQEIKMGPGKPPCLFCCAPTGLIDKALGDTVVKQEIDEGTEKQFRFDRDSYLNNHLRTIFIVRELLGIEKELCQDFLQVNDGLGHPNSWITVCDSCLDRVWEGYQVFREVQRLNCKLEEIRRQLKSLIVVENKDRRRKVGGDHLDDERNVQLKIIDCVVSSAGEVNSKPETEEVATRRQRRTRRKRKLPGDITVEAFESAEDPLSPGLVEEDELDPWSDDHEDFEWQPDEEREPEVGTSNKPVKKRKRRKIVRVEPDEVTKAPQVIDDPEEDMEEAPKRQRNTYMYKCPLCVALYRSKNKLELHQKLHENKEGQPCKLCGWYCSEDKPPIHRHKRPRPPPSGSKNYQFQYRIWLREEIPFYCDHCQMIFPTKLKLLQHLKYNHQNAGFHTCTVCNSSGFETQQILEMHQKDKHGLTPKKEDKPEEEKSVQCDYCSEIFPTKLKKDYHIARKHKLDLLVCRDCGHKSKKYHDYVDHVKLKHMNEKSVCPMCPLAFSTDHYLKVHMAIVHHQQGLGVPIRTCKECNVSFKDESQMKQHMAFVHRKEKPCCCEFCGKAFARKQDLKKHLLLHTAPREKQYKPGPFFCEFCQAKFNVRQALYYHMKNKHGDKYSLKCEFCGMGYATENTLFQHKRKCKSKSETTVQAEKI